MSNRTRQVHANAPITRALGGGKLDLSAGFSLCNTKVHYVRPNMVTSIALFQRDVLLNPNWARQNIRQPSASTATPSSIRTGQTAQIIMQMSACVINLPPQSSSSPTLISRRLPRRHNPDRNDRRIRDHSSDHGACRSLGPCIQAAVRQNRTWIRLCTSRQHCSRPKQRRHRWHPSKRPGASSGRRCPVPSHSLWRKCKLLTPDG